MAHKEQREYVTSLKKKFPEFFHEKKVLEIGSLNLNGTVRDFFTFCNYTGLDLSPGEGVDIVCEGQNYDAPAKSYDTVCSLECFEHNPFWQQTFENMIRLCKDGGLVFFTCATEGRPEHGTHSSKPEDSPFTLEKGWNYYENRIESDFTSKFRMDNYFREYNFSVNRSSQDLYFYGVKY